MPLPGNVNAVDHFQHAAYYAALSPEPVDVRQAVAGLMAIMRDVSVPFGAPYTEFGVYNTEYRTVVDLTYRLYSRVVDQPECDLGRVRQSQIRR